MPTGLKTDNTQAVDSADSFWNNAFILNTAKEQQCALRGLRVGVAILAIAAVFASWPTLAQETTITSLTVVKKPGAADGTAMATVKRSASVAGKTVSLEKKGRIADHAVQAWTIMHGSGALLLLAPAKKSITYRLRYYDADAGKSRLLGAVPLSHAVLTESDDPEVPWSFALSGTDFLDHSPVIYVGDTETIHALVQNGSQPKFMGDQFSFETGGETQHFKTETFMGRDMEGVVLAPANGAVKYIQFQRDGTSLLFPGNGGVRSGRWILEGHSFHVAETDGRQTVWQKSTLHPVSAIPASTVISVRLLQPLSSRTAKVGMEVRAVSITPAIAQGEILIPQGSEFHGKIIQAHGVGWGIKHETAALTLRFDEAVLPDGRTLPLDARVYQVDNSREQVTKNGKIQGIRSTGTLGHSAENQLTAIAQVDPMAYLFLDVSGPAVLGFAEPEILYNAGTDLLIQFHRPVITDVKYRPQVPQNGLNPEQATQLAAMVKTLPFRTKTELGAKPSDLTNLVFIGNPDALRRAFNAAGWMPSDVLNATSTFETIKTLSGNQTYTQAPMSTLLLNNEKPLYTLQKTTNTFLSRHHIRVFQTNETFNSEPVLTASSTQDVGIGFSSKQKTFIHIIDEYLDNERSKIINDLDFTGCVAAVDMVNRPWVPQNAYNSTGDRLRTDGKAAVVYLNDCSDPRTTPSTPAKRANLFERGERDTALTIKDTLYRGNVVYQGITGGMKAHNYFSTRGELGEETGNWRQSDASGTEYVVHGAGPAYWTRPFRKSANLDSDQTELKAAAKERARLHRWDAPRYEIALNLGYSRYRTSTLETTVVYITSTANEPPVFLALGDDVYDGWAAGVSVTLNTWNYISNEFSYMRQQTKFDLFTFVIPTDPNKPVTLEDNTVGLTTRRAAYNTVVNFRPRRSRLRPYIDGGPVFQLISLASAPLRQPSGYFRLGLSNIGLIAAAFDFGSTPPLNGGGIFQPGLQYGAGIKYRLHPRIMLRADFGETWSRNPQIIRNSYLGYIPEGLDDTYTTHVINIQPPASYVQQRATVGVAFTF